MKTLRFISDGTWNGSKVLDDEGNASNVGISEIRLRLDHTGQICGYMTCIDTGEIEVKGTKLDCTVMYLEPGERWVPPITADAACCLCTHYPSKDDSLFYCKHGMTRFFLLLDSPEAGGQIFSRYSWQWVVCPYYEEVDHS